MNKCAQPMLLLPAFHHTVQAKVLMLQPIEGNCGCIGRDTKKLGHRSWCCCRRRRALIQGGSQDGEGGAIRGTVGGSHLILLEDLCVKGQGGEKGGKISM